jgi:predicted P-loop ATPase
MSVNSDDGYKFLDDYKLNSISRELDRIGIGVTVDKLFKILNSDFVPAVNPLREYFYSLDTLIHDPHMDYIEELAKTVTVENPELFKKYLTKWIVPCVANVMQDDGCQNHTCLVLTGGQGKYKTTWLENLCPKSLRKDYLFTGKISLESKDTQMYLAEYFLVNVGDQLKNLNRNDENSLKTLITLPSIKIRRPYARLITESPRVASFMGSVNDSDFLTDTSGSRRFLPFKVSDINIDRAKSIDMDLVWKQAYKLYASGFRFFFDNKEIEELNKYNESFQVTTYEFELLQAHFKPCREKDPECEKYTSSDIYDALQIRTLTPIKHRAVSDALRKIKYERAQRPLAGRGTQWVYFVKPFF